MDPDRRGGALNFDPKGSQDDPVVLRQQQRKAVLRVPTPAADRHGLSTLV